MLHTDEFQNGQKKTSTHISSLSSESSPVEKEAPKANHRNRKRLAIHQISESERQAAGKWFRAVVLNRWLAT